MQSMWPPPTNNTPYVSAKKRNLALFDATEGLFALSEFTCARTYLFYDERRTTLSLEQASTYYHFVIGVSIEGAGITDEEALADAFRFFRTQVAWDTPFERRRAVLKKCFASGRPRKRPSQLKEAPNPKVWREYLCQQHDVYWGSLEGGILIGTLHEVCALDVADAYERIGELYAF